MILLSGHHKTIVESRLDVQRKEEQRANRVGVRDIFDSVKRCTMRGLALRGRRNENEDINSIFATFMDHAGISHAEISKYINSIVKQT